MLSSPALNPFLLLLDPSSVMKAVESSASLCSLKTRVFRPLELAAGARASSDELAAYDAAIETEPESEMDIEAQAGVQQGNDADRSTGALSPTSP
jgi:hypothetical protein